jgi:hypothetical protein
VSRKITISIIFLLMAGLLISSLEYANYAKANPSTRPILPFNQIYIRADGSIDPADAPIYRSGSVYYLKNDISFGGIKVQCSGITLDGKGHTLSGYDDYFSAINLYNVTNVKVQNFVVTHFGDVEVGLGSNNILTNNTFSCPLELDGESNTVIGNHFLNTGLDMLAAIEGHCQRATISGNVFSNVSRAMELQNCNNNVISNNLLLNSADIILMTSANNIISGNQIFANGKGGHGIYIFYECSNNTVCGNLISGLSGSGPTGSWVYYSYSGIGLLLETSTDNKIYQNTIENNSAGIKLASYYTEAVRNQFYQNNLINNTKNAEIIGIGMGGNGVSYANSWDNGVEGNYWSDYTGIGNYTIAEQNVDNHPLTKPYQIDQPNPNWYAVVGVIALFVALGALLYFRVRKANLAIPLRP